MINFNASTRTGKILKNLSGMFFLKGANVMATFLLVPITLDLLDGEKYGIWVTISGILLWIGLFDVGLGNGLRNKLTEALSGRNFELAKELISTTYIALIFIFFVLFLLFQSINYFLDWGEILNTNIVSNSDLKNLISIVFGFICLRFVFNIITFIAFAKQEPVIVQLIGFLGKLFSLIAIIFVSYFLSVDLLSLGLIYTSIPVLILLFYSIYLFSNRYSDIKPNINYFKTRHLRSLLSLGGKFFLIQISSIVFYQSQNLIITQVFGPKFVTDYNLTFQLFSVITILFSIILTPYWSAFTDAYSKDDFVWIKNSIKTTTIIWLGFLFGAFILLCFFDYILLFWTKKSLNIPFELKISVFLYVSVNSLLSVFSNFLNGIGKVSVQFYLALLFAVFQIPISIFSASYFGISGVLYPSIFFGFITLIVFFIQTKKIVNRSATGLWSK